MKLNSTSASLEEITTDVIDVTNAAHTAAETSVTNEVGKFYTITPAIIDFIVCVSCKILFKIFASHKVYGLENLEKVPKGVIFAANHSSELDPVLVAVSLPLFSRFLPMFYAALRRYAHLGFIKKILYGGLFFKMLGAYPVYTGQKDYERSLVNITTILSDNNSVCIFPEGGISHDGTIGRARGGIGYLVYQTQKPVIPVTIIGSRKSSLWDFLRFKKKYTIIYGKPLYYQDLSPDAAGVSPTSEHNSFKIIAEKIMDTVRSQYQFHQVS